MPLLLGAGSDETESEGQALVARVRADHAALQQAERDFQIRQAGGQLGAVESTDYRAYLSRLRGRVAEDCAALAATAPGALPADLPCPRAAVTGIAPTAEPAPGASAATRAASLEAQFRAGLSDFDEMLLQEQERVKAGASQSSGSGSSAGAAATGSGRGSGQQPAGEGAGDRTGDEGGGREASGHGGLGGGNRAGAEGLPPDVADPSGDDVVARQLREAAEKEQDPELREKLWDEYRNYKRGAGQ